MMKICRLIFVVLPLIFLSGCKMAILNPKGIIAASEKHLLIVAVSLMLVVVIPVILMSFLFAWRYREKNTNTQYAPDWAHSTALEIVWWTIPCIIIAILAVITWISTHKLDPYKPLDVKTKPIPIQAIALDWKWLFVYPEQHIATVNYVRIPVNVPIRFFITADAPMNSLEIPQLAGQIYAMTGMQTKLNLMASETGKFRGLSTNFSGAGFSSMNFVVQATSEQQFKQWVDKTQHRPAKLTMLVYNQLAQPSKNNRIEYFSAVEKDLFQKIIMKFMGPDMPMMNSHSHLQTAKN